MILFFLSNVIDSRFSLSSLCDSWRDSSCCLFLHIRPNLSLCCTQYHHRHQQQQQQQQLCTCCTTTVYCRISMWLFFFFFFFVSCRFSSKRPWWSPPMRSLFSLPLSLSLLSHSLPISLDIFRSGRSHLGLFLTVFLLSFLPSFAFSFLALACAFTQILLLLLLLLLQLIIINANDASISSQDRTHTAHCSLRLHVIELVKAKVHHYLFTVP